MYIKKAIKNIANILNVWWLFRYSSKELKLSPGSISILLKGLSIGLGGVLLLTTLSFNFYFQDLMLF